MSDDSDLEPCELGTLEYWDSTYKEELSNFKSFGDAGEVWFGDALAHEIVKWMSSNCDKKAPIIDIGSGNGMLLVDLAEEQFQNLTGVDYSKPAITLAEEVVSQRQLNVKFVHGNILEPANYECLQLQYSVVIDKGTYDAISLQEGNAADIREKYLSSVKNLLKPGGYFVIVSCNWTQSEITKHFEISENESDFNLQYVIPTPTFRFGGKVGSVVTALILIKRS